MSPLWPANLRVKQVSSTEDPVDLKPISQDYWDHFVAESSEALLFLTSDWLQFLSNVYGLTWYPLGIYSGDQWIGLFPLHTRKLGPFRLAGSPLMRVIASTPFLGPLVPPNYLPATLLALDDILYNQGIDHVEIAFPYLLEDLTIPTKLGYSGEVCETVQVQLANRTPEQLWDNLTPACRRAVRKAEANGVKIIEGYDHQVLDMYYQMCKEVYRGSGRSPHLTKDFYSALWPEFAERQRIKFLLAHHAGKIIAGAIFLLYRDSAYYLSGASYNSGLHLRPNNLIQWHFIQWAVTQKFSIYDMGGVGHPGITRFKLSFGGQSTAYNRLYRLIRT